MVRRIPEMTEVNQPHENANDGDNLGEHITKIIEFALERCFFTDLGRDRLVNMTNCSAFAGQNYDSLCTSANNSRTL